MLINANKSQPEQTQNLFAFGMSDLFLCQSLSILPGACSCSAKKHFPKCSPFISKMKSFFQEQKLRIH